MPLADIENDVLSTIQQPGASFGSQPNWTGLNSPQYYQALVDFYINEGYRRACSDLYALRMTTATFSFPSVISQGSYPIPPPVAAPGLAYPQMKKGYVFDVFYLPLGATQAIRFEPGASLISWEEFQRLTGQSYLRANSAGLYPRFCAVGPNRNTLEFYPNPLESGDAITVIYPALPTVNAQQLPTLVAESDTIALPEEAETAIAYWACARLFPKSGALATSAEFKQMYGGEIERIKLDYMKTSMGDAQIFTDTATFPVYGGLVPLG